MIYSCNYYKLYCYQNIKGVMKTILIFLILFTLVGCNSNTSNESNITPEATIYITKTEVGYNIYSNKGNLILEYTKRNCDSLSLKMLEDIYYTAKEFYDREIPNDENESQPTKLIGREI